MIDIIKRMLSAAIDFFIICFIATSFIGIITLGEFSVTTLSITIYLIICVALLLLKDFAFKNASIGKRILKLEIVKADGSKLMFIDLIKRNIPIIFLLPIEVVLLITKHERIGDRWTKTYIVCA